MKKTTLLLIALIGLLAIFYIYNLYLDRQNSYVIINEKSFAVELAVTPDEQNLGLGNRDNLPENSGMLFIFGKPGNNSFWMRGMEFPLDMIFILDKKVVGVYANVPVITDEKSNPRIYGSDIISDKVLEINAGLAKKYNIKKGDEVRIEIKN